MANPAPTLAMQAQTRREVQNPRMFKGYSKVTFIEKNSAINNQLMLINLLCSFSKVECMYTKYTHK